VLLHGHCHHKATGGIDPERNLLEAAGAEVEVLDSGCCGMAGSWGYERDHYDVSQACGERVLFPKVREAPADALVVADGFSCKTQIEQGVGRKALHVAQVLRLASGGDPWEQPRGRRSRVPVLVAAGAAALGAWVAWRLR
jgi:Fe-S oxidoreductase